MPIVLTGVNELSAALTQIASDVGAATEHAVALGAALIESKAKKRASGRPGPNVVSGANRQSVQVDGPVGSLDLGYTALVGPSMIYSRRLELGFVGTDSIGRVYKSPAKYPFILPGLEDSIPGLPEIFEAAWAEAMGVG